MRRRQLLVGSGTVAAAALAGCIGSAQPADSGDESRTLTIRKSGEATAEPDQAVVHLSIEATGETPAAVRDELSERSQQLTDGLLASGLDEDAITTGRFTIREDRYRRPPVEPSDPESAETTRYQGQHSFRVEVDSVDSVGTVVDTAVESGADSVEWIEFTLSAERRAELRQEALDSALDAARTEAVFVAREVDKSVVDVKNVDTTDGGVSSVRREFTADAASSGQSTELRPDEIDVHASVKITYTIE